MRRSVEQYLFLKYDMAEIRRKKLIRKDWGSKWYNYLFYDTPLFDNINISNNFGLPIIPDQFDGIIDRNGILTNNAIYEIIIRLYTNIPLNSNIDDTLTKKDMKLIDKIKTETLSYDDIGDIEDKIYRLIDIRVQRNELEGCIEYWLPESYQDIDVEEDIEIDNKKKIPQRQEIRDVIDSTLSDKRDQAAQEFFDSDSDQDDYQKDLSRIEEERTDQIGDLTPLTLNQKVPDTPLNDKSRVSHMINNNNGGNSALEKPTSDYVSSDAYIRSLVQKNILLKGNNKLSRLGSVNLTDNMRKNLGESPQQLSQRAIGVPIYKSQSPFSQFHINIKDK